MPAQDYATQSAFDEVARVVWIMWNRDMRRAVIQEGGIEIFRDGELVGTVGETPGGGMGISYVYDGAVTSAQAIAAIHKATLEGHTTTLGSHGSTLTYHGDLLVWAQDELSSQAGTLLSHGSTLNSHGGQLGTHTGQISALQSTVSGLQSGLGDVQGALSSLQSTVGGMPDYGAIIGTLVSKVSFLEGKVNHIENYLSGGGTGPFNPGA